MKAKNFKLCKNNPENRAIVINKLIADIECLDLDNDYQVILKNYDVSKTAKQRRLDWRWNNEIARSGIGSNDDPDGVHMNGKWNFARPLLLAGEDQYSLWIQDVWALVLEKYPNDGEKQKQFFIYAVHTEKMEVKMISEYLKEKQYFWTGKGVNLTDPSLAGLE